MACPIEISIFGNGSAFGESVLIRIDSNWIVIDSCLNPGSSKSLPLEYLNGLGVDLETQVKYLVATHWHDDHIRGLSQIVEKCTTNTIFAVSAALRAEEFANLLGIKNQKHTNHTGVNELCRIVDLCHETRIQIKAYQQDTVMEKYQIDGNNIEISVLSPSSQSIMQALKKFALFNRLFMDPNRSIVNPSPNHYSMVIQLKINDEVIILGADLENTPGNDTGWNAINTSKQLETGCRTFKVAHHGSSNGHNDHFWEFVLAENFTALLTPWKRGGRFIPKKTDVERIKTYTDKVFITCDPEKPQKNRMRSAKTDKVLKELEINIQPKYLRYGQVKLTGEASDLDWDIELLGTAKMI
ncbi:MAG: MBL fold metallo-hydrolase [Bacteroidota bacterium]